MWWVCISYGQGAVMSHDLVIVVVGSVYVWWWEGGLYC